MFHNLLFLMLTIMLTTNNWNYSIRVKLFNVVLSLSKDKTLSCHNNLKNLIVLAYSNVVVN